MMKIKTNDGSDCLMCAGNYPKLLACAVLMYLIRITI